MMQILTQDQAADISTAFDSVPWGILTPSGLLMFAVWLLLTGRIVPRRTLDDTLEELRFLRRSMETMQTVKVELAQQNSKLLGDKDLSVQILKSARAEEERVVE